MSVSPTTQEGIAITLAHIQEQVGILVARSEKAASREDLVALRGDVKALEQKVRTLEDDRTERKAVLWLLGAVVTAIGLPGVVLVLRAFLASSG